MPKYDSPPTTTRHAVAEQAAKDNHGTKDSRAGISPPMIYNPFFTGNVRGRMSNDDRTRPIDRQSIIRKIKKNDGHVHVDEKTGYGDMAQEEPDQNALGLGISRPRSALHRGDFRDDDQPALWTLDGQEPDGRTTVTAREWQTPISTSPVVPWHHDFPSRPFHRALNVPHSHSPSPPSSAVALPARPRAVSNVSLSSSFTYQPPTSPLVHQANAADIPDHDAHALRRRPSPDKRDRRNTYSPRLLHQSKSALDYPASSTSGLPTHAAWLRRETPLPYQAHQPRRSIASFSSLPYPPIFGARRPSLSEASPSQHAPMVGSYEESILRGRMATPASKPLNFVAQIGVLGKGDCKPKCPPHLTVPFPAVFYSYPSGLAVDPEPSPYVGMVDLESLPKLALRESSRKRRRHHDQPTESTRAGEESEARTRSRKHHKTSRTSHSPNEPSGGCYRIPQQGQLQIVLKNPNKTAVKLFLVPYDLSDMEPGQKTFIRQRNYSAGPIIDMPVTSRNNYGTDRPEAALSATADPKDRPILRYLIHLNICCPSRHRYYLYQNIRVVFANRVPDGKEKLRSETQMPDPRYSAYKPGRDSNTVLSPPVASDQAKRRRSAVYPATSTTESSLHSPQKSTLSASVGSEPYSDAYESQLFVKSFDNRPYRFPSVQHLPTLDSRPSSRGLSSDGNNVDIEHDDDDPKSPTSPLPLAQRPTDLRIRNLSSGSGRMKHLPAEADRLTFSREASRERASGARTESLLSRRLKDLEMRGSDTGGETGAGNDGDL